jgi:hypothetical protein
MEDIEIPLSKEEEEEKINFLRNKKFKDFRVHPYYNKSSYIKHAVELEKIQEIYPQFEKIIKVFKRPAKVGFKYSFIYKLSETKYLILSFFLNELPPKFFNAYFNHTNLEREINKKYTND